MPTYIITFNTYDVSLVFTCNILNEYTYNILNVHRVSVHYLHYLQYLECLLTIFLMFIE